MTISALDFSLTSSSLTISGKANSASELAKFIEQLKEISAVLPKIWPAIAMETRQGGDGTAPSQSDDSAAIAQGDL
jgi:hypothetical protein